MFRKKAKAKGSFSIIVESKVHQQKACRYKTDKNIKDKYLQ